MIRKLYISAFFVLAGSVLQAQNDVVNDAIGFLQAGNTQKAAELIDLAVKHEDTKFSFNAWYIKGFAYKELFKKDTTAAKDEKREIAIESFQRSMKLDTAGELYNDNIKNIKYLAATYYNDAVSHLNTPGQSGMDRSLNFYGVFMDIMTVIDTSKAYVEKAIEFNLNLGLIYAALAKSDSIHEEKWIEKAKACYNVVLGYDPKNFSANYRMGILYYNLAVDIINRLEWDIELYVIEEKQDTCIVLAKGSLPYLLAAHKLEPLKPDPIKGLVGIYYLLNEKEISEEYVVKLEGLKSKDGKE